MRRRRAAGRNYPRRALFSRVSRELASRFGCRGCATLAEDLIRVAVAPIPVFGLLFPVGLSEFMLVAVVFGQETVPVLVFVVVPVMVVLMLPVVDAIILRRWRGYEYRGSCECGGGDHTLDRPAVRVRSW